ncbi:TAXI family TRAP transporter solute-binding subunit [uncultured Tolumonas sp.]|uniref:TAXI family TRAP transporter solute-binding subunit n=1 Tax=uncultured Tolumonas sp. TaxID=263765 RepID=UPI00292DB312|nr:TAXI family TRAP transporter solute-binding subunit [uncultured Tolumonas sp.]
MSCMRFFSVRLTNALTWMCLTLGISSSAFAAAPVNLTISTGSVSGVYYPAGGAICRLLNKSQKQHQLRCSVTTSEGSIANIQKLRNNEVPLAIVQSDIEQHAFTGATEFAQSGPMPQLRALFSLYSEAFTLVVREDSHISQLSDLVSKRVDIGNPGSGERATMELLMQQLNWKQTDFSQISGLHADERAQALCDNQIDAFVYVAGHPNGAIREATNSCDAKLLPLPPEQIASILKAHPEYSAATIPGGLYRDNDTDTATIGVTATLLTTDKLDDETAYQVVKAAMENLEQLERSHPALKGLNPENMTHVGLTVPLHPGAARYYREHNIKM